LILSYAITLLHDYNIDMCRGGRKHRLRITNYKLQSHIT